MEQWGVHCGNHYWREDFQRSEVVAPCQRFLRPEFSAFLSPLPSLFLDLSHDERLGLSLTS
jgi:hypothetical protein